MTFQWNPDKANSNVKKHGVSFEAAAMSQEPEVTINDEMRPEYDFSGGVRGKHCEAYT